MSFTDLRDRVLRLRNDSAESQENANRTLNNLGRQAAKLCVRVFPDGLPGFSFEGYRKDPVYFDRSEFHWQTCWNAIRIYLQHAYPGRAPDPFANHDRDTQSHGEGVNACVLRPRPDLWRQRAEDYAAALKLLDQLLTEHGTIATDRQPAPNQSLTMATQTNQPPARHSFDFRSVHWYGPEYSFTAKQAAIVKLLWEAWDNGTPDVADATLLEACDLTTSRLVDIFRNNPAWGSMIVEGRTKGTRRLSPPDNS